MIGVHPTLNHCHPFAVAEPYIADNYDSAHQDGDDWYYEYRRRWIAQKSRPLPGQQRKELIHWKTSCTVMASETFHTDYSPLALRYWEDGA